MKNIGFMLGLVLFLLPATEAPAVGISIDAGLTPPEGRWILRTQVRAMSRTASGGMGGAQMDRLMVPLVVVHGLRPQFTLGVRQIIDFRTMTVAGVENNETGLADLYLFAKYKVLRVNTRSGTLGIAPLLGVEVPTGARGITNDFWSLDTGLLISGRAGRWGADLNARWGFRGVAGVPASNSEPGDILGLDLALARQFPVGNSGQTTLAPVLELTWQDTGPATRDGSDVPDTGESILFLAPGLKFTQKDLIFEGLVRFPVSQEQEGMQMEAGKMYLLGVRRMF